MQTLNKGEWSEAYCILKVIADKKLHLCNSSLELTGDKIPVVGGRISNSISYKIADEQVMFTIGEIELEFSLNNISALTNETLNHLLMEQKRTFAIPTVEKFFKEIGTNSLKAKASDKIDAIFCVADDITNCEEELGFSVKSFLAGSPTLINASHATNFLYKVGLDKIDEPYKTLKAKELLRKLSADEVNVIFDDMDSIVYKKNLMTIDLKMPDIIAEMIKIYFSSKVKTIRDIVPIIQDNNPLNLADVSLYKNKIIDFLFYSSVGMFPNKNWDGIQYIDGGCLIVNTTGEVLCFYIFRKNFLKFFREYLFNKCFLDTASTTRHKFARLYDTNGEVKLKLNLQIRIAK